MLDAQLKWSWWFDDVCACPQQVSDHAGCSPEVELMIWWCLCMPSASKWSHSIISWCDTDIYVCLQEVSHYSVYLLIWSLFANFTVCMWLESMFAQHIYSLRCILFTFFFLQIVCCYSLFFLDLHSYISDHRIFCTFLTIFRLYAILFNHLFFMAHRLYFNFDCMFN